jgi:hypothetical protein
MGPSTFGSKGFHKKCDPSGMKMDAFPHGLQCNPLLGDLPQKKMPCYFKVRDQSLPDALALGTCNLGLFEKSVVLSLRLKILDNPRCTLSELWKTQALCVQCEV